MLRLIFKEGSALRSSGCGSRPLFDCWRLCRRRASSLRFGRQGLRCLCSSTDNRPIAVFVAHVQVCSSCRRQVDAGETSAGGLSSYLSSFIQGGIGKKPAFVVIKPPVEEGETLGYPWVMGPARCWHCACLHPCGSLSLMGRKAIWWISISPPIALRPYSALAGRAARQCSDVDGSQK